MSIWAHTIVKNEERYIWFSVMSVINFVDKILIWDTGSTDKTCEIISEIKGFYPDKVVFKEWGEVNPEKFTLLSQKMLEKSDCDWFIILDGDEVWWDVAISEVAELIRSRGRYLDSIVSRFYTIVGDIYHYQEEKAGRYKIDNEIGHLTIRAMNRRIPGVHFARPHGQRAILDSDGTLIQERNEKRRFHPKKRSFLHFTNVVRSKNVGEDLKVVKRNIKLKYELGNIFPLDFYYPEVFFRKRPKIVSSPWQKMDNSFFLKALIETPFRKVKRRLYTGKSGY